MDIQNKRLSDDEFNRLRQEVLTQWPTGKDVDLEEAVAPIRSRYALQRHDISYPSNQCANYANGPYIGRKWCITSAIS